MSKLDWMYKSSSSVDPEDYLLGKAIDKNFEAQGSSKNEVDKDILPTSIFANSNSSAPVDIFRKIKEDPLEQIKQKEIEMRKQLLKNPVKLKKLQSMLKAKAEKKSHKKNKKKSKSKDLDDRLAKLFQKYGAKKVMALSKSDDSEEEDNEKSKESRRKTKQSKARSHSSYSSDENQSWSRDRDGRGRASSKDQYVKYENKKTVKRSRSSSDSSSERRKSIDSYRKDTRSDHRTPRDDRGRHNRNRSESDEENSDSADGKGKSGKGKSDEDQDLMAVYARLIEKHGAKKLMELVSDDSEEEKSKKKKKKKKSKATSDPSESDNSSYSEVRKSDHRKKQPAGSTKRKDKRRSSSQDSCSLDERSSTKYGPTKQKDATREPSRKHKQRSSSSSSYSPDDDDEELKNMKTRAEYRRRGGDSSDDEKSTFKKAYGLVLPKGVEAKPRSSSRPAAESSTKKADAQKGKFVRPKPSRLTEEEKEAKLKEMMANAQWRDKERKTNVAKYREEEKREASSQKYDEGFMRKELAKAFDSSKSVEERIKSRMNNVQRSKFSMSQNFARRN